MPPLEGDATQTDTTKAPPADNNAGGDTPPAAPPGDQSGDKGGKGAESAKPEPAQRPESVPEAFWDAEKGQLKADDLGKAYSDLAAFKAGLDSLKAQTPDKPDGYEFKLPEGFQTPEGLEFNLNPDDERVQPFKEWAHKWGIPQDAFAELYAIEAKSAINSFVADKEFRDAEMKKLGEKGPERIKAVEDWLDAVTNNKDLAQAGKDLIAAGAEGVQLFETLMKLQAGPTVARSGGEGAGKSISEETHQERVSAISRKAMAKAGVSS